MKTRNDMRGIERLTGIAPVLFIVLALFACTGGNPVNKKKEEAVVYALRNFKDPAVNFLP
jgi:ABC-type molybdate transport system substrate-binding protein